MSKEMHYAGLMSARSRRKYRQSKHSVFFGKRVRHLSETEITEFQEGVRREIARRTAA